jgi:antitoxin component YwqK of YwqJK toxin-antitoxin module
MLVTFDINGRHVKVPYDKAIKSEYVKNICDIDKNVAIVIPEKYYVTIYRYVDFLNNIRVNVYDRKLLADCFDLYTYLGDEDFFNFLIIQLLNSWSLLFTIVYTNLHPDVRRKVYLNLPYPFIPESVPLTNSFFDEWFKLNSGVEIIVDCKDTYVTRQIDHNTVVETTIYKPNNVVDALYYYNNNVLKKKVTTVNGKRSDWAMSCHRNGETKHDGEYMDDKYQGVWLTYDTRCNLETESTYENGVMVLEKEFYPDTGIVRLETKYNKDGSVNSSNYDENGNLSSETHYGNSMVIEKEWYSNSGLLKSEGVDTDGCKTYTEWYEDLDGQDHQLILKQGKLINDIPVGDWIIYDKNGNVTIEHYNDDNGGSDEEDIELDHLGW